MPQTTDLVVIAHAPLAPTAGLVEQAQAYAEASRSDNTKRAYAGDWADFTTWCNDQHCESLPATAQTVALYITAQAQAGKKVATITRRLASISQAHQLAGYASPTQVEQVRTILKGIRRTHTTAQDQAAPITIDVLRLLVSVLPADLLGQRDRALLLLGFAGALRRSEIVALQVEDVTFSNAGAIIRLKRSKTDQEGAGLEKGIPYGENKHTCPVRALKAWLKATTIDSGPIFRPLDRWGNLKPERLSDRAVARVIQRTASAAGLDATHFSGHSLRAGLITTAAAAGISEGDIMAQSGHRSSRVMRGYIRRANLFKGNAAGKVGL